VRDNPDQFHVVRRVEIDLEQPVAGTGLLEVRLTVRRLGRSSCAYGFTCVSEGERRHASGVRVIVKLDPELRTPSPWTERFRALHLPLIEADGPDG
jgi:acyl-CoA thioester hydrolase